MSEPFSDERTSIQALRAEAARLVRERAWEPFHSPRNLAMGLSVEAGELAEVLLWKSDRESQELDQRDLSALKDECADVLTYLLHIANRLDFDLARAFQEKLARTEAKYPIPLAHGRPTKYTRLQEQAAEDLTNDAS